MSPAFRQVGLLLACAMVLALVAFGQLPGERLWLGELQNTLHVLLFTGFTYLLVHLLQDPSGDRNRLLHSYLLAAGLGAGIGIAAEIVQAWTGRGFSDADILRDCAGIMLGAGLYALRDRAADGRTRLRGSQRAVLVLTLAGVLLTALYAPVRLALHYTARAAAFPVILDLQAGWSATFVRLDHAHLGDSSSPCATGYTLLTLQPAVYPGIKLVEPYPDWRDHDALLLDLHTADSRPLELTLRIHDRAHNNAYSDRFNRRLIVQGGNGHFRIPLQDIMAGPAQRTIDAGKITSVILFAVNLQTRRHVCLGKIRLERVT